MELHGNEWKCMEMQGNAWKCMEMHGNAWTCMDMHGHAWACMDMHGHVWKSKGHAWFLVSFGNGTSVVPFFKKGTAEVPMGKECSGVSVVHLRGLKVAFFRFASC